MIDDKPMGRALLISFLKALTSRYTAFGSITNLLSAPTEISIPIEMPVSATPKPNPIVTPQPATSPLFTSTSDIPITMPGDVVTATLPGESVGRFENDLLDSSDLALYASMTTGGTPRVGFDNLGVWTAISGE